MKRIAWFCIDIAVLFLLWAAVTAWVPSSHYVLPPISAVFHEASTLIASGDLLRDVAASMRRTLQGFGLAVVTAIPIGLLLGSSKRLFQLFDPLIEVLRPISPIAWIPLSILWFGIGEGSKLFIIWLIAFFFILLSTISGVVSVNSRLIEAARMLGASQVFIWRKVIFWAALPQILVGIRLGLAVSIGGVLLAEMVAAEAGIGFLMERARVVLKPEPVIIGMMLLGALGYSANRLLVLLEHRLLRHRGSVDTEKG